MATNDYVSGKNENYYPDDYRSLSNNKAFKFKNCVCVFFASFPDKEGLLRKYMLVDYFDEIDNDSIKRLDFKGGSPMGFYIYYRDEKTGRDMVEDINQNNSFFWSN